MGHVQSPMMTSIQAFPDCALPAEQPGGQDGQSQKYMRQIPKTNGGLYNGENHLHYFSGFH